MSPWMHARRRSVELFLNLSYRAYNCKMSITFDAMRKTRKTYTIKTTKYINKIIHYFFGGEIASILLDANRKSFTIEVRHFWSFKRALLIGALAGWVINRRARIYAHKPLCSSLLKNCLTKVFDKSSWFDCLVAEFIPELCQLSFVSLQCAREKFAIKTFKGK